MHDTAMVMIKNGTPVRSIFPKEGAVETTNFWCQPLASTKIRGGAGISQFLLHAGSAGTDRPLCRLGAGDGQSQTEPERAGIRRGVFGHTLYSRRTEARFKYIDYMERQFTKMVTS